jgi:hypothetical protein
MWDDGSSGVDSSVGCLDNHMDPPIHTHPVYSGLVDVYVGSPVIFAQCVCVRLF